MNLELFSSNMGLILSVYLQIIGLSFIYLNIYKNKYIIYKLNYSLLMILNHLFALT